MVVTHVFSIILLEPPVPITSIPFLILMQNAEEHDCTSDSTYPEQSKTGPIPCMIQGLLGRQKDVASHDSATVSEADLHC